MIPMLALVKRYGLRAMMVMSAICNMGAGAIRIVVPFLPISTDVYFWLIFVSQSVAMIANPIVTCVAPEVSSAWFKETERSTATSVSKSLWCVPFGCS
jgi:hypothetical protein